ncbi:MAG: YggS family pyridoxal phosphate-dependent enzyme [Bacteroidales bacterium]|nr:YggS family pyridoxal phosphate-dependent enzyme [Bacteroidales bacterium]MBP5517057.1 YggS family pyridoxal phosphate-dependent enzyme [Bacteroidales bacterium]
MSIIEELSALRKEVPSGVKLVLVSKFQSNESIMEAYNAGHKIFAENYPQEFEKKVNSLPKDIEWHFIGHLQSNKIKMVVPYAELIHSVDSEKLLYEIEDYCLKHGLKTKVLLEIHVAREATKQGFTMKEAEELLEKLRVQPLQCVTLSGIMGMATLTDDNVEIQREFTLLYSFYARMKQRHLQWPEFKELSMGMSEDYKYAIRLGSTILRIGTKVFGQREQK